jgi:excisionase family DNA binding protein
MKKRRRKTNRKLNARSLEARIAKARLVQGEPARAVSVMEAAAMLRIGKSTMHKLIRKRMVKSFKIGKSVRIPTASIDRLVMRLQRQAKAHEVRR